MLKIIATDSQELKVSEKVSEWALNNSLALLIIDNIGIAAEFNGDLFPLRVRKNTAGGTFKLSIRIQVLRSDAQTGLGTKRRNTSPLLNLSSLSVPQDCHSLGRTIWSTSRTP